MEGENSTHGNCCCWAEKVSGKRLNERKQLHRRWNGSYKETVQPATTWTTTGGGSEGREQERQWMLVKSNFSYLRLL